MNITAPKIVALKAMPRLVTLIQARKQARWHWAYGADEHQHRWSLVIAIQDARIAELEKYIGDNLDIVGFHGKREIVE